MRIKTTIKDKNKTDEKKKQIYIYTHIYIIHVFQTHRDKTVVHILERTPSFLGSSLPNPLQTEQYTVYWNISWIHHSAELVSRNISYDWEKMEW